jgi:hypothetical protein
MVVASQYAATEMQKCVTGNDRDEKWDVLSKTIRLKLGKRLAITSASSSGTYKALNFTYTPLRRQASAYGQLYLCSGAVSTHYTIMNSLLPKHTFTTDNQVQKGTHTAQYLFQLK